mgnify:CR=1 FL=1
MRSFDTRSDAKLDKSYAGTLKHDDEKLISDVRWMHRKRSPAKPSAHGEKMLRRLRKKHEFTTHSLHNFFILFSLIRNSNLMNKMCAWRVVSMCVAWSAYIKENTTHLSCVLYILEMYFLFMNTGFEPTTFILPFYFA